MAPGPRIRDVGAMWRSKTTCLPMPSARSRLGPGVRSNPLATLTHCYVRWNLTNKLGRKSSLPQADPRSSLATSGRRSGATLLLVDQRASPVAATIYEDSREAQGHRRAGMGRIGDAFHSLGSTRFEVVLDAAVQQPRDRVSLSRQRMGRRDVDDSASRLHRETEEDRTTSSRARAQLYSALTPKAVPHKTARTTDSRASSTRSRCRHAGILNHIGVIDKEPPASAESRSCCATPWTISRFLRWRADGQWRWKFFSGEVARRFPGVWQLRTQSRASLRPRARRRVLRSRCEGTHPANGHTRLLPGADSPVSFNRALCQTAGLKHAEPLLVLQQGGGRAVAKMLEMVRAVRGRMRVSRDGQKQMMRRRASITSAVENG